MKPETRYIVPDALRADLARPWGPVVSTSEVAAAVGDAQVLAVGDVVSMTLRDLDITPKLLVVDYRTQRHEDDPKYREALEAVGDREVRVRNPPATITREAWDAIADALAAEGTTRIVVDGEEDMLGIPCFLEAGAGSIVLYGIPGEGVAVVPVDARVQAMVGRIVEQMVEG